MRLLQEMFIAEAIRDSKKGWRIEGVMLQGEIQNKNGRVYPFKTLSEEVARYVREFVETGRAVGELGHPSTPAIGLDRVSHRITGLTESGNDIIGQAQILDTPMGEVVKGLLGGGVKVGVSSRGIGTLKESNGKQIVQPDFKLAAIDIVGDPSAPGAFVEGLNESVSWIFDAKANAYIRQDLIPQLQETAKKKYKTLTEEEKFVMFSVFISNLK